MPQLPEIFLRDVEVFWGVVVFTAISSPGASLGRVLVYKDSRDIMGARFDVSGQA
jgi:hypothetical protein